MQVSKKLIENVGELKKALNEISVYDLDVYTSMELYYNIANKLNEVITELMRFEGLVSDEVIKQNEKLVYLLGEGLNTEVVKKINQMVADGTMDTIINHKLFTNLNNKVENYKEELTSQIKEKVNKGESGVITHAMLSQEVREEMTGGSVAVVGDNSILNSNLTQECVTTSKKTILGEFAVLVSPFPIEFDFSNKIMKINYNSSTGGTQVIFRNECYNITSTINVNLDNGINMGRIFFNIKTNTFKSFSASEISNQKDAQDWVLIAIYYINEKQVITVSNYVIIDNNRTNTVTPSELPKESIKITSANKIEFDLTKKTMKIPYNADYPSCAVWKNNIYIFPNEVNFDFSSYNYNFGQIYFNTQTKEFKVYSSSQLQTASQDELMFAAFYINKNKVFANAEISVKNYIDNDIYKYPNYPVWGHEYLISWYKKIINNENIKMVWAGDSTTHGAGVVTEEFKRHNLAKKIMILGGYDKEKITSINKGHESRHTGNWLSNTYPIYPGSSFDVVPENGYLDEDMNENPDLYILGYGQNDGSSNHFTGTTIEERIDNFETRMREGLSRIRTNNTFTSGPSYNKSVEDMAIIIAMPISTYYPNSSVTVEQWHNKIRPILQKLCREFKCAFVDLTVRQYDHSFSSSWSSGDSIHPNNACNADYMSMFSDLLYPITMHNS